MVKDERAQILMDLGLTLLQAKIYLALSQKGKATAKTISKTANIARQDVYRIMPIIENLGLAEKLVAAPTMYRATPIKEGYYLLLENKTQEHTELQKKTMELIKNLHESNEKTTPQEEEPQFAICLSEKLLWKWLREGLNKARISADLMAKWEIIKVGLFNDFQDFERAVEMGVKIRVITAKHEADKSMQKIMQTLTVNPLFEIRYFSPPVLIETAIYDGTEVGLNIAMSPNTKSVPSLMSNHPKFAKVMMAFFEGLWNKAVDASETLPRKSARLKPPQIRSAQPASKRTRSLTHI